MQKRWAAARWPAVIAAIALALATPAAADAPPAPPAPPPPPPQEPYPLDESCTVAQRQGDELECFECAAEHQLDEACQAAYQPWGFDLVCGSELTEIWCRDLNGPFERVTTSGCAAAPARADDGLLSGMLLMLAAGAVERRP